MQRLHNVTGIKGLYARSLCAPEDNAKPPNGRRTCAGDRATQYTGPCGFPDDKCPSFCKKCGVQWRNSTAKGFEGWVRING